MLAWLVAVTANFIAPSVSRFTLAPVAAWAGLGCSWYHFTYPVGAGFGFCGGLEDFSIPNLAYGFPMANFDKKITKLTSITRKTKE